jgi:hypothetical protein
VVIPLENDADILPGFKTEVDGIMRQSYGDDELMTTARSLFERAKSNLDGFHYLRLIRPFGLEVAIAGRLEQARSVPTLIERPSETRGILVGLEADASSQSKVCRLADCLFLVPAVVCEYFAEDTR